MNTRLIGAVAACLVLLGSLPANADVLFSRLGGQAIYDQTTNLTWLANANKAVGSAYDTYSPGSGQMTWADANAWVATLTVDGVGGWTLPTSDTCQGTSCTNSEMGNLYYNVLGGTGLPLSSSHNSNYNLFSKIQDYAYWSSTADTAPTSSPAAWSFDMYNGRQGAQYTTTEDYAWAVHTGDVSVVPLPASLYLFGTGLVGMGWISRRKRARNG